MRHIRPISADAFARWLAPREQRLKWTAVVLGIASTLAIVQDLQPWPMVFGLPFCVIWVACAWLRTEPQLKYINVLFTVLYVYGLMRWLLLAP